jgi:hypothetical protein
MFDSDLSKDLTSGVVGGIGSGRRIMKASRLAPGLPCLIADDFSWNVVIIERTTFLVR